MKGYILVRGGNKFFPLIVDKNTQIYLNDKKAYLKQLELNKKWWFYDGSININNNYPKWDDYEQACKDINNNFDIPPFNAYQIKEIEIIE